MSVSTAAALIYIATAVGVLLGEFVKKEWVLTTAGLLGAAGCIVWVCFAPGPKGSVDMLALAMAPLTLLAVYYGDWAIQPMPSASNAPTLMHLHDHQTYDSH